MTGAFPCRRSVLAGLALTPALPGLAAADRVVEAPLAAALRDLGIAPHAIRWGDGVALIAPALVDDGSATPVTVRVTEAGSANPVRAVHLFAPANRRVLVSSFVPGEDPGRLEVTLRIRLAKSQAVTVAVQYADGRAVAAATDIQVTAGGGCRT